MTEPSLDTPTRRIDRLTGWGTCRAFLTGYLKASVFLTLTLGMFVSCAPTFEKGGKSPEAFDLDSAQCLQDNSSRPSGWPGLA